MCMLLFQIENGSPGNFLNSVYSFLIVQIEFSFINLFTKKQTEGICFQTDLPIYANQKYNYVAREDFKRLIAKHTYFCSK